MEQNNIEYKRVTFGSRIHGIFIVGNTECEQNVWHL